MQQIFAHNPAKQDDIFFTFLMLRRDPVAFFFIMMMDDYALTIREIYIR